MVFTNNDSLTIYTDICAYIVQIWWIKSADGACTHSCNYHLDDHYHHHYHRRYNHHYHQHCRRPARRLNIDKLSANVKMKLRHFQTIPFRDDKSWTCNLRLKWEGGKKSEGILRTGLNKWVSSLESCLSFDIHSRTDGRTFVASNLWTKFRISLCLP